MRDRINKPRVFLSHSKRDVAFIERLFDDLRKCQIDPWLDAYEIRHGQPWLDAIFEDGLPTCDAVLVYLSEHSIASSIVKKEIDAGILQKLRDNQIAFLPYVTEAALRTQLRSDLQTLQSPEWNEANYRELLPRVVAEVWRSYLERTVVQATQRERVARLEAELRMRELEKQQEADGFAAHEASDFEYIWRRLDRFERVIFIHRKGEGESAREVARHAVEVHVGSLLPALSGSSKCEYHQRVVHRLIHETISPVLCAESTLASDERIALSCSLEIGDELLMYGFLTRFQKPPLPSGTLGSSLFRANEPSHGLMYAEKLERFKHWLARKGLLPQDVQWRVAQEAVPPSSGPAVEVSPA